MKRPSTIRGIGQKSTAGLILSRQALEKEETSSSWRARPLEARPGFLIRRIYQIHVALFMKECSGERVTPVQYSLLTALEQLGTVDQATLSRAIALDRTTVADVVARLEGRKLLKRRPSTEDGRMMLVSITEHGKQLLARLEDAAALASERTISALPPKERKAFLSALKHIIAASERNGQPAASLKLR